MRQPSCSTISKPRPLLPSVHSGLRVESDGAESLVLACLESGEVRVSPTNAPAKFFPVRGN